ncbi:permease prefix domain 1-containing protein [Couchioplanes caeruleus]|uniref:permease prefix domain 1-containing protein n=1 Tax=Couchioplanes caeruleus TaxID=56438 RepID=UPI0020BE8A8D|nr:permease prefix domain 1-containing protein [Couchioplanes caeruleus]UQU66654.1 permease prefix domain 1-containing protein [Couchioplanes caeruleus]
MTLSDETPGGAGMHVHRLLDEAFAGVEMGPEQQDLKEEMRGNLVARVAELTASGMGEPAAARRAVDEMGDVRAILDATEPRTGPAGTAAAWQSLRVRTDAAFAVRTVVLSALAVAGLAVLALAAYVVDMPLAVQVVAVAVVAAAAGVITADALRQETTGSHPMPPARAAGYGAATLLAVAALGAGWLYLRDAGLPWLIAGALVLVVSAAVFTYLGATQTNRHKAWVVQQQQAAYGSDRFSEDPAAAARFGIYTVTVWLVAAAAFVALTLTAGWAWSWLAVVGGFVAMTVLIARMLFAPKP